MRNQRWKFLGAVAACAVAVVPLVHADGHGGGSVDVSGYVAASYTYNLTSQGTVNVNRHFNSSANGFSLDAAKVGVAGSVGEMMGGLGQNSHFAIDAYYGGVAQLINSSGTNGNDDVDIAQAYVGGTLDAGNGVDWQIGKFGTLLGAESIDSPANMFTSHATQTDYLQPYTHTGLLLSYAFNEKFSASVGVVNGNDIVSDNNKEKSLLYGLSIDVDPRFDFSVNGTWGSESADDAGAKTAIIDVVANARPADNFTAVANFDLLSRDPGAGADKVSAFGVAVGGQYDINPGWAFGARFDLLSDTDQVVGLGTESLMGVTGTLTARHNDSSLCRLELRLDNADADVFQDSDGAATGSQITVGLESVHSF